MRNLFLSLCVLLLVALAGGSSFVGAQNNGTRPPSEVRVINDAGSPVPTQAIGTTAVSGSVTIANSDGAAVPTQAVGTTAVTGSVTIANSDGAPVPVRNVDVPAAPTPWVVTAQIIVNNGEEFDTEQVYTVPLDKRLVIEAFTIEASVPTGQVMYQATILASTDGVGATFRFPLAATHKTHATFDRFATAQLTRINVGAGNGVVMSASRTGNTGTAVVNIAMSGFLVDQ